MHSDDGGRGQRNSIKTGINAMTEEYTEIQGKNNDGQLTQFGTGLSSRDVSKGI